MSKPCKKSKPTSYFISFIFSKEGDLFSGQGNATVTLKEKISTYNDICIIQEDFKKKNGWSSMVILFYTELKGE